MSHFCAFGARSFRRSRTPKSALSQKCLVSGGDNQYVAVAQFRTLVAVLVGGHPDKRCGTASPAPIKCSTRAKSPRPRLAVVSERRQSCLDGCFRIPPVLVLGSRI